MTRFVLLPVICVLLFSGCSGGDPGNRYAGYLRKTCRILEKYEEEPDEIVKRLTAIDKKASRIRKTLLGLDSSDALAAFSRMEDSLQELSLFLDTRGAWNESVTGLLYNLIP